MNYQTQMKGSKAWDLSGYSTLYEQLEIQKTFAYIVWKTPGIPGSKLPFWIKDLVINGNSCI